jgi:hypothetical protein
MLSVAAYLGALLILGGGAGILRPFPRLGLRTRRRSLLLAAAGAACCLAAFLWPTPTIRVAHPESALDTAMPAYQFVEHYETFVRASPPAVFDAIHQVTAEEIRGFQTLTWIRNPRLRSSRETILSAPADRPILAVALGSGFTLVAERPGTEIAIATQVAPGVSAIMNFEVHRAGGGLSRVSTETRVHALEGRPLRAFTVYWRYIYPGSALIRVEWLKAIKRRAEAAR